MSESDLPPIVPIEYSGKWIAWNFDETKILVAGDSYADTKQRAEALGEKRPVLVKAPASDARFIGGHR